ncbi:hypothetical protein HaloA020_10280 [Halomonas sp. A020]|nr:hypothetical protein HaloA020_10280 [Halomonas sp. A020]
MEFILKNKRMTRPARALSSERGRYRDELPQKQTWTCIPAARVIRYNASGL